MGSVNASSFPTLCCRQTATTRSRDRARAAPCTARASRKPRRRRPSSSVSHLAQDFTAFEAEIESTVLVPGSSPPRRDTTLPPDRTEASGARASHTFLDVRTPSSQSRQVKSCGPSGSRDSAYCGARRSTPPSRSGGRSLAVTSVPLAARNALPYHRSAHMPPSPRRPQRHMPVHPRSGLAGSSSHTYHHSPTGLVGANASTRSSAGSTKSSARTMCIKSISGKRAALTARVRAC
jgi:hypothetical protein